MKYQKCAISLHSFDATPTALTVENSCACELRHFHWCEFVKIFGNIPKEQVENTIFLMQMQMPKELNSRESILLIAYIYLSYGILHTIYHRFYMHMNKEEKWFCETDALNLSVFLFGSNFRKILAMTASIWQIKYSKWQTVSHFLLLFCSRSCRSLRSNVDISSQEKLTFDKKRVTRSI